MNDSLELGSVVVLRKAGLVVYEYFAEIVAAYERLQVELLELGELRRTGPSSFDRLVAMMIMMINSVFSKNENKLSKDSLETTPRRCSRLACQSNRPSGSASVSRR